MDGNKDESEDCIRRCKEFLLKKNYKKAQWFASKAHQLYPSEKTKSLLEQTNNLLEQNQDEEENSETNSETFNNREQTNETSTNEQPRSVDYIKHCKDYYEILVVKKTATELEIKKQYKKLALQFHPDKNKSPGASEAFKAISAAFAVLSDPEKRRRYDERGNSDDYYNGYRSTRRRSDGFDYSRGFEEEFNADEIFNMFFGRGFFPTQNVYVYRNGTRYSHSRQTSAHHHHQQNTSESQATAGYTVLLQIMPILFFICISLLSNFVPDNPYSLSRSHKYPYQRFTENFQVPYFVKENFERDYKDTLHQIESHVEEAYISNLQTSCFKERNYKENLIYRAKFLRDSALESKAQSLRTPSCDKLVQIEKSYYSS